MLQFGERFWELICAKDQGIKNAFASSKIKRITYSDRYIQNPATVTTLGSVLICLKKYFTDDVKVGVNTLFKSGKLQGRKVFDDWADQDDFELFTKNWLEAMVEKQVTLNIATSNREIPHHRKLEISFDDGSKLRLRFDQGVAYWQVRYASQSQIWFDFDIPVKDQLMHMANLVETARIQNSEQKWATDVLVELIL